MNASTKQAGKDAPAAPAREGKTPTTDDQPQREDEFLSDILGESNPEKKPATKSGQE